MTLSDSEEGNSYCEYSHTPKTETVRFSTVHDIGTEGETLNADFADNSAEQISPTGVILQGDQSNNLLIEALPVDKPGEYLPVDTHGEHLPLNVSGALEKSNFKFNFNI